MAIPVILSFNEKHASHRRYPARSAEADIGLRQEPTALRR